MKKFLGIAVAVLMLFTVMSAVCFAENTVTHVTAEVIDGKVIINANYSSDFEDEFVSAAIYDAGGRLLDYFMVPSIPGKDSACIVIDDLKSAASVKVFVMADKYSFEPVAGAEKVQIEREENASVRNYAIVGNGNINIPMGFVHPKTGKPERYCYVYFPESGNIEILPYNRFSGTYPSFDEFPHLIDNAIVTYEVDEKGIYNFTNIGNTWSDWQAANNWDFESECYLGVNRDASVLENETDATLEVYVDMEYENENDRPYVCDGRFEKNADGTFRFFSEDGWQEELCNFIVDENTVMIIAEEYNMNGMISNRYRQITAEHLENAELNGHFMDAKYIVRNNPDSTENEYLSYFVARVMNFELVYDIIEEPVRFVADYSFEKKDNGMYSVKYTLNNPYTGAVETAYSKDEESDQYMLIYEKAGGIVVMNAAGQAEISDEYYTEEINVFEFDAENGTITDEDDYSIAGLENALIWRMGSKAEDVETGYANAFVPVTADELASNNDALFSCNTEFVRPVNARYIKAIVVQNINNEAEVDCVTLPEFIVIPVSNCVKIDQCDYELDSNNLRIIKGIDVYIDHVDTMETATGGTEEFTWYCAYYDFINPYTGAIEENAGKEMILFDNVEAAECRRSIGEVVYTNKAGAIDGDYSIVDEDSIMWATGYDAETGKLSCMMYGALPNGENEEYVYDTDSKTSVIVLESRQLSDLDRMLRFGVVKTSSLEKLANPDKDILAQSVPYFDENDTIKYHYGKYPKIVQFSRPASDDAASTEKIVDFIVVIANGSEPEKYCNID